MNEIEKLVESLKSAIYSREEVYKEQIYALKETALNAFLACEGYDDFDRVLQDAIDQLDLVTN